MNVFLSFSKGFPQRISNDRWRLEAVLYDYDRKGKGIVKGYYLRVKTNTGLLERIRQVFVGTNKWFIFQEVRVLIL